MYDQILLKLMLCSPRKCVFMHLYNINRLVFITEAECVYCALRPGSLNVIEWFVFIPETECVYCAVRTEPLTVIDWFVFITETESVYCAVRTGFLTVIDWLVFITETERRLLRGTDWMFKYNSD